MNIKCQKCGQLMVKKTSNYRYKESGLDNLYLKGITVLECSCGASSPSIFRMPHLHNSIAETLLKKPVLLSGREIRFLRKTLYLPANIFAKTLGVGKTTLSKWENGLQQQSEAFDRLTRATYLIAKGLKKRDQINTLELLKRIELRKSEGQYVIIAERIGDDYMVNLKPIIGGETEGILLMKPPFARSWTATTHAFAIEQSQVIYNTLSAGTIKTTLASIVVTGRRPEIVHGENLQTKTGRSFVLQEAR